MFAASFAPVPTKLDIPDPELAAVQFISLVRGDAPFLRLLLPGTPMDKKLRNQLDGAIHMIFSTYKSVKKKVLPKNRTNAAHEQNNG